MKRIVLRDSAVYLDHGLLAGLYSLQVVVDSYKSYTSRGLVPLIKALKKRNIVSKYVFINDAP